MGACCGLTVVASCDFNSLFLLDELSWILLFVACLGSIVLSAVGISMARHRPPGGRTGWFWVSFAMNLFFVFVLLLCATSCVLEEVFA